MLAYEAFISMLAIILFTFFSYDDLAKFLEDFQEPELTKFGNILTYCKGTLNS